MTTDQSTTTCCYCGCDADSPCTIKIPAHRGKPPRETSCRRIYHDGKEIAVCTTPACVRGFHMGIDPVDVLDRTPGEIQLIEQYSEDDAFDMGVDILSNDERTMREAARVRGILRDRRR